MSPKVTPSKSLSRPPVTLLTKRAYVDLLRTASAACRYPTAS
jgi:hypothetical protein